MLGRLHEALVNGGGVWSLVHAFGVAGVGGVRRLPGLERRETWGTRNSVARANIRSFDSAQDDRVRSGTEKNTGGWTSLSALAKAGRCGGPQYANPRPVSPKNGETRTGHPALAKNGQFGHIRE